MRSSFRVIVTKIAEQDMRVTRDFTYSLYCQLSLSLSGSYSAIARLTGHLLGTAGCRIASHSPVFDSHLFLLASVHPPHLLVYRLFINYLVFCLFALRPCLTTLLHLQRSNRYRYPPQRQRQSVLRAAATAFPNSRGHLTTLKPPLSRLRLGSGCL